MLKDIKQLYDLGFAIHWIKEKSKMPVQTGWTTGPRQEWLTLKEHYHKKLNVGVRLGTPSKISGKHLAVIDCDVKSKDKDDIKEMNKKLLDTFGPSIKELPMVLSGRGNGSRHYYFLSDTPISASRVGQSSKKVKVHMPSVKASSNDKKSLTDNEIKQGYRSRAAWEISIMGDGQQVVLPPSIHPDSGKPYQWYRRVKKDSLKVLDISEVKSQEKLKRTELDGFKPVKDVDLYTRGLDDKDIAFIESGEDCNDRSAQAFGVVQRMVKCGYSRDEILTVFTDTNYFIGTLGFEHAKTKSRKRAANWIYNYTFKKAKKAATYEDLWSDDDIEPVKLSKAGKEKQDKELKDMDDWRNALERSGPKGDGPPKSTLKNILLILENELEGDDFLSRNEFTNVDMWTRDTPWGSRRGQAVTDSDSIKIKMWLSNNYRFEPSVDRIDEAIILLCLRNAYHPVRAYLNSLKWDGVSRLDTWLSDYLNAEGDSSYLAAIGSKTLIAMVKRIYEPGCKFDNVLILEGDQGVGKSSTARILASDDWFSDSDLNIGDKDSVINMQGAWVYELGELSAMSRYDVNRLKEFISRSTDKIRPPFGKRLVHFPRQSVFIGTTNNSEYLKDFTGNRRYWPVRVDHVDMKALKKDRDQLFAEAVERYTYGEPIYIDSLALQKVVEAEQGLRVETDELSDAIKEWLDSGECSLDVKGGFKLRDLFEHCPHLQGIKMDRTGQMRVAGCLRRVGFNKKRRKDTAYWISSNAI